MKTFIRKQGIFDDMGGRSNGSGMRVVGPEDYAKAFLIEMTQLPWPINEHLCVRTPSEYADFIRGKYSAQKDDWNYVIPRRRPRGSSKNRVGPLESLIAGVDNNNLNQRIISSQSSLGKRNYNPGFLLDVRNILEWLARPEDGRVRVYENKVADGMNHAFALASAEAMDASDNFTEYGYAEMIEQESGHDQYGIVAHANRLITAHKDAAYPLIGTAMFDARKAYEGMVKTMTSGNRFRMARALRDGLTQLE